jgi:DNA-binding NtrC family response regulator
MFKQGAIRTILIIDEYENIRIVFDRERSDQSYVTRSPASGLKSFQFTENNPQADLLILDVRTLGSPDGQVLTQRGSRKLIIPVILYSRGSSHKSDLPTWLAGFYRVKSSDLKEFKEKVKEFVDFEEQVRSHRQSSAPFGKEYKADCASGSEYPGGWHSVR